MRANVTLRDVCDRAARSRIAVYTAAIARASAGIGAALVVEPAMERRRSEAISEAAVPDW